jgi:hypothetical protein
MKSQDHSPRYVLFVLLLALVVVVMHANCGNMTGPDPHDALAVVGQTHSEPMATTSVLPADEPSIPADPCHATGGGACCLSALLPAAPRQLLALMGLAIAVVVGAMRLPCLQGVQMAHQSSRQRHPPDLSTLCVLRI